MLNAESPVLRITRAGDVLWGAMPGHWTVFSANHSTYETLGTASLQLENDINNGDFSTEVVTVLRVCFVLLFLLKISAPCLLSDCFTCAILLPIKLNGTR